MFSFSELLLRLDSRLIGGMSKKFSLGLHSVKTNDQKGQFKLYSTLHIKAQLQQVKSSGTLNEFLCAKIIC